MSSRIDELIASLESPSTLDAVGELVAIGSEAVRPLLQTALDPSASRCSRTFAVIALGQIRDPAIRDPFHMMLKDPDVHWETKRRVAWALGELGDAASTDALVTACHDSNSDVRGLALAALGKVGDASCLDVLCSALADMETMDDYTPVAYNAVWAIGAIGGPEAVSALCELIESWTPYGQVDHTSMIIGALQGSGPMSVDDAMCMMAAKALAECGDHSVVPRLRELHEATPSKFVKAALLKTVESLSGT